MKQIIILQVLLAAAPLCAQNLRVIGTAGNIASGGGIILCFTVGETAIAQRVATDIKMGEGFWQPGRNTSVAVVDIAGVQGDIRVFPNPTSGQFTLDLGEGFPIGLRCTLLNAYGIAVESMVLEKGQKVVIMGDPTLEGGIYVLQLLTTEGQPVHTFRVLKM